MAIYREAGEGSPKREVIERALLGAFEELLDAGASYSELNIERITRRAGISRTAFYFYFRDKRELLIRLTEQTAGLLYAEADRWWSGAGDGPRELLLALDRVISLYTEHGTVLRSVADAAASDEQIAQFWRALVGRFVQASHERIESEQAAGEALPGPAEAIAFTLVWATEHACFQQVAQNEPLADAELRAALAEVWMRTVYGRGAGGPGA